MFAMSREPTFSTLVILLSEEEDSIILGHFDIGNRRISEIPQGRPQFF